MLVDDSFVFINVRTGRYPLSLEGVREELFTESLPRRPRYAQLQERGYCVVKPTERPSGVAVQEGSPEPGNDGFYYQQWRLLESATEPSEAILTTFKNQANVSLQRQHRSVLANGYATKIDTDVVHIPLDTHNRLHLLELWSWVQGLEDDDVSMVQIPTKETVFETCSVLEAKALLSEVQDYCRGVEQTYLALKKQVLCANTLDDLPTVYDNTLESALPGVTNNA